MLFNIKIHRPILRISLFGTLLFVFTLLSACAGNKPIILYDAPPEHGQEQAPKQNTTASLSVPVEIDLVYTDGKRRDLLTPYQPYITFKLLPGKHVYGFQYQDVLLNEDGNEETMRSPVVLIRFTATAGGQYIIDFDKPSSFAAALKLEESFALSLSELGGNGKVKTQLAHSFPAPQSPVTGWMNTDALGEDVEDMFGDNSLIEENEQLTENATPKKHLRYWWGKASDSERNDFKKWIKQNP